nr:rhodanese-like domain-containing protein [Quadrisphaera sp. DSM 44207]
MSTWFRRKSQLRVGSVRRWAEGQRAGGAALLPCRIGNVLAVLARILDAAGHLPVAVFADVVGALSDPDAALPLTRPGADRLAGAFGRLGIGDRTTVVLYDATTGSWAARVWWLLRGLEHDRAAVLDGGLRAWTAQGRPLEAGCAAPAPAAFVAPESPRVWADRDDVLAVVRGEQPATLLDAISRPPRRWRWSLRAARTSPSTTGR